MGIEVDQLKRAVDVYERLHDEPRDAVVAADYERRLSLARERRDRVFDDGAE